MITLVFAAGARADDSAVAGPSAAGPAVLVVGDSISAAYGMRIEDGWVALLERRLGEQGYGHRVVNASISGDTTRGGRGRLPRALARHSPDVVIIELGGNDGLRGIPLDVVRENLSAMIDASLEAGARVVLAGIQIPSNYGPRYAGGFERIFEELAQRPGVAFVPRLLERVALDAALMQDDGIHPNEDAQPVLLAAIWPHVQAALGDAGGVAAATP